jgi:hypothetical protein
MLTVVPLTLMQANNLVWKWHRHHRQVVGHRFSLGCRTADGTLVGAAIVGRPVARGTPQFEVAEITRLVTNGYKNACSFLYAACARVAKEMGFKRIQTYILDSEPGISLRAAGWQHSYNTEGGSWSSSVRTGLRRTDQPQTPKQLWHKVFQWT